MDEISDLERFKLLRSEVSYEAALAVQRTAWFVAAQAFFFTSLATGMPSGAGRTIYHSVYFPLVPILALIVCGLTFLSVAAALWQAGAARRKMLEMPDDLTDQLLPGGAGGLRLLGVGPTLLLPIVFASGWIAILFQQV